VCIDVRSGAELWRYAVPHFLRKRITFSNAVSVGDTVCFGASDGNFYALDIRTGKRQWISFEADWIYGHPASDEVRGLVFAPLSFGLKGKQGSVVAFDVLTGKARWTCNVPVPVMGGITAVPTLDMILFGTEDGHIYSVEASTGKGIWEHAVDLQPRGAPLVDMERGQVCIGGGRNPNLRDDEQGALYALNLKDGTKRWVFEHFRFGTFSTPALSGATLCFTALDGFLYALDASKGTLVWKCPLEARSFASPLIMGSQVGEDTLVVGSNNGRLLEVDIETGKERSVTHLSERIVNVCAYAKDEGILIVPTQGNEFYALAKKASYTHERSPA
jgi:outer membrane protein assembly factor BamB